MENLDKIQHILYNTNPFPNHHFGCFFRQPETFVKGFYYDGFIFRLNLPI